MQTLFRFKTIYAFLLLLVLNIVLYLGVAAGADKTNFLADRHQGQGMTCATCHKESPPKASVPDARCNSCHGPYAGLAELTKKVEPNPHASHLGDLACDTCHHGHKPSVDHCSSCHTFGLKVP
jgi:hypothetical protein